MCILERPIYLEDVANVVLLQFNFLRRWSVERLFDWSNTQRRLLIWTHYFPYTASILSECAVD